MNKQITLTIVALLIVGGGSFYGGMRYAQSKGPTVRGMGQFSNLTPEERQARAQQFGGGVGAGRGGTRTPNGGQAAAGEIISKDDKSITVKLGNGGSRIIFISGSTQVMKTTQGSAKDLTVGQQITAMGTPNPDGSISAQTVQLRPAATTSNP